MTIKRKFTLATVVITVLFLLTSMRSYAMDTETLEKRCDQIISALESEDKDMELCATHIPLTSEDNVVEIQDYFNFNYYCGDTNVVFVTTTCTKHGGKSCLMVESVGSSKQAAKQHKEAVSEIQKIADSISDGLSEKEKADAAFSWVTEHVVYSYSTTEEARAAASKTRGGFLCYDGTDLTVYSALTRGKSVCIGQALLFNKICKIKHVPCSMASNSSHAFNIVNIDNAQLVYDTVNGVSCGRSLAERVEKYPAFYKIDRLV